MNVDFKNVTFDWKFESFSVNVIAIKIACLFQQATVTTASSLWSYSRRFEQFIFHISIGWHDRSWTILNGKLTMLELLNIY